ncbi:mannitol dehydrogenase family protein [Modestobacter sp. KNN46-3]|jgi:mannitol 2-dehydrogenase|uniref:mannitol dehydrogenase family protein n=1 Tax=Modestobacter sp. KNN46-3 TaxID=2711218 RepID=UPI0013DFE49C|nr:mannitol dehydrogenase family protein [Modestobacter sp. KNN46-3]
MEQLAQHGTDPTGAPTASAAASLSELTLPHHAANVRVPTYDRAALTPAVVHFSVGGFHRAHQLVYLDDLAESGCTDWGVVGVGLRSPQMRDALQPQDHLYTVVERSSAGEHARVIGSLIDYLFAPDSPEAVLAVLTDERTRLVTMTITGNAYRIDAGTGRFVPDAAVHADLADPHHPRTLFGYIVEALDVRRRAGLAPFTVLSCDNMQSNGEAARAAVVGFAQLRDPGLAAWIDEQVTFPGSMVDRITPSTSLSDRDEVTRLFGVADRWPVITEPFSQWVLEDSFCNGRPPLEQVGVQFVADVGHHELMKTRLLNGSHSAMGHLGELAGVARVDEFLADPVLGRYVTRLMAREVAPLLPAPDGIDLGEYQQSLLRRFADPAIGDRLDRLCRRGSSKIPLYVLPSLLTAREQGRPSRLLTLAVAGWCRYLQGTDLAGRPLALADDRAEELGVLARAGGTDPRPLLAVDAVFGDLGRDESFVTALATALRQLEELGVRGAVAHALAEGDAAAVPAPAHSPLSGALLPA